MKAFLMTWVMLCFLVIVGLLIAYTTDQLPGRADSRQAGLQTEECSPCEENLARLRKVLEQQASSQEESGVSTQ